MAQQRNVAALREAERTALARYDGGVSAYLEVLDAQRELFSGENALAQATRDQHLAVVSLYKALGGGWNQPETPPTGTASQPGSLRRRHNRTAEPGVRTPRRDAVPRRRGDARPPCVIARFGARGACRFTCRAPLRAPGTASGRAEWGSSRRRSTGS